MRKCTEWTPTDKKVGTHVGVHVHVHACVWHAVAYGSAQVVVGSVGRYQITVCMLVAFEWSIAHSSIVVLECICTKVRHPCILHMNLSLTRMAFEVPGHFYRNFSFGPMSV